MRIYLSSSRRQGALNRGRALLLAALVLLLRRSPQAFAQAAPVPWGSELSCGLNLSVACSLLTPNTMFTRTEASPVCTAGLSEWFAHNRAPSYCHDLVIAHCVY